MVKRSAKRLLNKFSSCFTILETYFFAILIGGSVGLAVALMLYAFHSVEASIEELWTQQPFMVMLTPVIGLLLSQLLVLKLAYTKRAGCGTHAVLEAYNFGEAYVHPADTVVKTTASVATIGLGGSAGLEGPSLLLGSGIASLFNTILPIKDEDKPKFFLAGAAAGISAVFRAPLTGVLFALEIPFRRDVEREAFIHATLASVISYIVLAFFIGAERLFPPIPRPILPSYYQIMLAVLVGLIAALIGRLFVRTYSFLEKISESLRREYGPLKVAIVGGLMIGLLGLIDRRVLGVGYEAIHEMVLGRLEAGFSLEATDFREVLIVAFLLLILKVIASSITLNFGGSGGLFIPSIFVGAALGYVLYFLDRSIPAEVYVMAGMAAVLAATNKTLFTSVAFTAETAGPATVITTMIAASVSYFFSGNESFYENQLLHKISEEEYTLKEAYVLLRERYPEVLSRIRAKDLMTRPRIVLRAGMTVAEAIKVVENHILRVFAVVDSEGRLIGQCFIENLIMASRRSKDLPLILTDIRDALRVHEDESLGEIIERMLEVNETRVYVVDQEGRLIGVITTRDILRRIIPYLMKA
ncbi:MAG: hypothetical protein DRJ51_04590 [Thermoprotei archaeon]|nr:MAG: hypothetical protein DRJ51_04590 [Thermoprotei archaeon]RLF00906.1 MAG: hypothetical protein DRJ59_06845 [Thermoprotei archaeon]